MTANQKKLASRIENRINREEKLFEQIQKLKKQHLENRKAICSDLIKLKSSIGVTYRALCKLVEVSHVQIYQMLIRKINFPVRHQRSVLKAIKTKSLGK